MMVVGGGGEQDTCGARVAVDAEQTKRREADTSCRDPETSQRQRLGAHEPCWPQDLLHSRLCLAWSRYDALALPLVPLHVPPPPSPCSSCPPSMSLLPLSQPTGPTSQGVHMCRCPPPCSRRLIGWLFHDEARPEHYSLALHREGGGGPAYAASPGDGTSERRHPLGLAEGDDMQPSPSPMGLWQCRALHVGLHERERYMCCVV
jgi:hypothetical protein